MAVERTDFRCLMSDCPFFELEGRVLHESLFDDYDVEYDTEEVAPEICLDEMQRISDRYGITVPCGLAGRMVVAQTTAESRG